MRKTSMTILASGLLFSLSAGPAVAESKIYVPDDSERISSSEKNLTWRDITKRYAPSESKADWRKVVAKRHWQAGKSAFETATAWENANPDLPPEIAALFYGPVKLLAATPEHKTPLPGGRAASQSDVLAFVRIKDRVCAVAVEGKKDEAFGETVGEWLQGASAGKIKRLTYISEKLGLPYPPPNQIRYQLLHRTAAVVIEAERFNADCAAVIVQSFSPEQKWFADFGIFLGLFGIQSVSPDKLYKTNKPGMTLYFGWASSAPADVATTGVTPVGKISPDNGTTKKQRSTLQDFLINQAMWLAVVLGVALIGVLAFIWKRPKKDAANIVSASQKESLAKTNEDSASAASLSQKIDALAEDMKGIKKSVEESNVKKAHEFEKFVKDSLAQDSAQTPENENYKNGLKFEEHVVHIFNQRKSYFEFLSWSADKISDKGIVPKNATEPDLKYQLVIRSGKFPFAVECKWRKGAYNQAVQFAKEYQLKNYKAYEKRTGEPTFIVLGVGQPADNPPTAYILPVRELTKISLTEQELAKYRQPNKNNFRFDPKRKSLRLE